MMEILCKRTNDPKLAWLERMLTLAQIEHVREGVSFHGPILKVDSSQFESASRILDMVDEISDDLPLFTQTDSLFHRDSSGRYIGMVKGFGIAIEPVARGYGAKYRAVFIHDLDQQICRGRTVSGTILTVVETLAQKEKP